MNIQGVIFDMDGVIIDNHKYHYEAWLEFCQKYGIKLTPEVYRDQFNGKTNKDLFPMLFGALSEEKIKAYTDEKEAIYKELYAPNRAPLKGLVTFLEDLKQLGIKTAIGTSAPPTNVEFILDHLDLRKYFSVIVDGPQVKKGKPDPEVYQLCVRRLGLRPEECIVFEDALAGLEAGKRAGCKIIGVATSHTKEELQDVVNDIIEDFSDAKKILGR